MFSLQKVPAWFKVDLLTLFSHFMFSLDKHAIVSTDGNKCTMAFKASGYKSSAMQAVLRTMDLHVPGASMRQTRWQFPFYE